MRIEKHDYGGWTNCYFFSTDRWNGWCSRMSMRIRRKGRWGLLY